MKKELEGFLPQRATVPMPAGLAARLRGIPETVEIETIDCGDVDRLYESALAAAHRTDEPQTQAEATVQAHLNDCERCRRLHQTLRSAFRVLQVPLPRALGQRLRRLGAERRRPPWWVRDSRIAVAASAILTAGLMLLPGNPAHWLHLSSDALGRTAEVWTERGSEGSARVWEEVRDVVDTNYERGRERFSDHSQIYREFLNDAVDLYQENNPRRFMARFKKEGDDHEG